MNQLIYSNRTKKIILVALAAVSMAAGSVFIDPLNEQRERFSLTHTTKPLENSPPGVTLATTALGGFRNLIVDVLWIRAMKLKEAGDYFELAQLYNLIGDLQPHFADIWAHNAWNMAYNISVTFPTAEERWIWVQKGIKLLRDKGIPLNTRSALLYKELAWIYMHKLGHDLDDAHKYYKRELAHQMRNVLDEYVKNIKPIAEAHENRESILGRDDVKALKAELKSQDIDLFKLDLEETSTLPAAATAILESPENIEPAKQLMLVARGKYLAEKLKLDPEKMVALAADYNWLDWRLPEVHALYWIEESVFYAEKSKVEVLFYERMRHGALKLMFERGRLVELPSGDIMPLHDLTKADALNEVYRSMIKKYDKDITLRGAHRNWLTNAAMTFFVYGEKKKAFELYKEIVETYLPKLVEVPFEDWAMKQLLDQFERPTPRIAEGFVYGLLFEAIGYYDLGEEELGRSREDLARFFYEKYQTITAAKSPERIGLRPWTEIKKQAVGDFNRLKAGAESEPSTEKTGGSS